MDPDVVQDKPGDCPKCGMKLEKHHAFMEQDFQKRFFITLPLVLLTMLLSPNIQMWLNVSFDFPGRNLMLFLIGTFIFFFGGFSFLIGAH